MRVCERVLSKVIVSVGFVMFNKTVGLRCTSCPLIVVTKRFEMGEGRSRIFYVFVFLQQDPEYNDS